MESMGPQLPLSPDPINVQQEKPHKLSTILVIVIVLLLVVFLYIIKQPNTTTFDRVGVESFLENALTQNVDGARGRPSATEIESIMRKAEEPSDRYKQYQIPKIISEKVLADQDVITLAPFKINHDPLAVSQMTFEDGSTGVRAVFNYDTNLLDTFQYYKNSILPNYFRLVAGHVYAEDDAIMLLLEKGDYLFRIVMYPSDNNSTEAVVVQRVSKN
ncbi:MAG: hypothetical protein Q7R67_00490 [bacterium]|nr:hypothetical protein [bacterium]